MPAKDTDGAVALADAAGQSAPQVPLSIELLMASAHCALGMADPNAGPLLEACIRTEIVIIDAELGIGEVRHLIDLPDRSK
jgi:hypothetical protein